MSSKAASADDQSRSEDPSLKSALINSVLFHGGVLALFFIQLQFFTPNTIEIQSAVRVDMVTLPNNALPEKEVAPPAASKAPIAPPEIKEKFSKKTPEPLVTPQKKISDLKQKQNRALKQLSALSSIEDSLNEEKNKKSKPIKGDAISKGTSLQGLRKMEFEQYFGQVDQHIKSFWALPEWFSTKGLRCRIRVLISSDGKLLKQPEIVQSSSNTTFDNYARMAIEEASPFPRPPDKLTELLQRNGIVFAFPE